MPFVLLTPVIVIAAVVAWAVGVPGRRVVAYAGGAIVGLFMLTVVSTLLMIGLGRGGDEAVEEDGRVRRESGRLPVRGVDEVLERREAEQFPRPAAAIDELQAGESRVVKVDVAEPVRLHQCVAGEVAARSCTPGVPAAQGDGGDTGAVALFEFDRFVPVGGRRVDCMENACVLVAVADGDEVVARAPLVFGTAAPDPRLFVPTRPLEAGDDIAVRLSGLPAGARGRVTYCTPSGAADGAPRCGSPAPEVRFTADDEGDARVSLPVYVGGVAGAGECGYRKACAVGVLGLAVPTPYAPVSFAGPAGPELSTGRTLAALAAAGLLLAAAFVLIRGTDWTPPGGDPFANVSLGPDPFAGVEIEIPEGW